MKSVLNSYSSMVNYRFGGFLDVSLNTINYRKAVEAYVYNISCLYTNHGSTPLTANKFGKDRFALMSQNWSKRKMETIHLISKFLIVSDPLLT